MDGRFFYEKEMRLQSSANRRMLLFLQIGIMEVFMFYTKEEIDELKRFAAAYGYELDLICPAEDDKELPEDPFSPEGVRSAPEKWLAVREKKAS